MVKTEKYQDEIECITQYCKKMNAKIGNYKAHYLTSDKHFSVELDNGILKIPIRMVVNLQQCHPNDTGDFIVSVVKTFHPFQVKAKTYKKILSDWQRLFKSK